MIRLNDERYWLYAAVDPDSNELLHTRLEPTTTNVLAHGFFADLREKHDVEDVPRTLRVLVGAQDASRLANAVVLVDGAPSPHNACIRHGLEFRHERHGNRNSVERVFRELKRRTSSLSNCFGHATADTADDWLRSFAFAWNQLI